MAGDPGSSLAQRLVDRHFAVRGGVLHVGGSSVEDLAAEYGTPAFVYDGGLMRGTYRALADAVRPFAEIHYSIKANPHPGVVGLFLDEGAGLEIASVGEFETAISAGCPPERILFAGPGKTDLELERVIAAGIGEIHAESEHEIRRIGDFGRRAGRIVNVSIRVNPALGVGGGSMMMGGIPSPFGIDEERLFDAIELVADDTALSFCGIHMFTGTQILDPTVLGRQWKHGVELAGQVALRTGRAPRTLDLGGGLGIPYFAKDAALDLTELARLAAELSEAVRAAGTLAETRIILEPGRFLTGPAGIYLVRVVDVKESRGERFVVVDGGMHHHLAASGNLGQVIKRDYPVVAASKLGDPPSGPAAVVGPLCTPLDVLARRVELPALEPGDLIAVLQSGAYGLTASPTRFLSRPPPVEVLLDERQVRD